MTVATKTDSAEAAQPLEITSLHGAVRERPPRSRRAVGVGVAGLIASGIAIAGALLASGVGRRSGTRAGVRPRDRVERVGRVRRDAASPGAAGLDHGRGRRDRRGGTGSRPRRPASRTPRRATRPCSRSRSRCCPRSVCTSRSALPRGTLEHRVRRGIVVAGYAGGLALAASLYSARPDVSVASLVVAGGIAVAIGLVGFVRRCRGARTAHERARLQWLAWGVVVAAALAGVAAVLDTLVSWPPPVAAVATGCTVLVPISLVLGASDSSPCGSTGCSCTRSPSPASRRWSARRIS